MSLKAIIYNGRDNTFIVEFQDNGLVVDLSGMSKAQINVASNSYNSVDNAALFDITDKANGRITFILGDQGIVEGEYNATIVLFDAVNTNGIVWMHEDDDEPLILEFISD